MGNEVAIKFRLFLMSSTSMNIKNGDKFLNKNLMLRRRVVLHNNLVFKIIQLILEIVKGLIYFISSDDKTNLYWMKMNFGPIT